MVTMRWVAVVLILAACGYGQQISSESQPGAAAPAMPAASPEAAEPAPTSMPSSSTTAATLPAPRTVDAPQPPSRQRLLIHGTGDVNLSPRYAGNDPDANWAPLREIFQNDDLTVVNLECTPSEVGAPVPKAFNFRCPLASLPIMRDAGVEVANLGNNHSQDYGTEAMLDGRQQVIQAGMYPVGVGADHAEATLPALFDINGWTIAVLGFGGVVPHAGWLATDDSPGMANGDDAELMAEAVRSAAAQADLVIVSIHWGWELETEPRQSDIDLARAMIEAGADMIFGHHQHRLNPMTYIDGVPVAWGLGNFIWQRGNPAANRTAIAQVVVDPDGTIRGCLLPATIVRTGVVEVDERECAPAPVAGY